MARRWPDDAARVRAFASARVSSIVFQALQPEHWPCHLLALAPHSRQTKSDFNFEIN